MTFGVYLFFPKKICTDVVIPLMIRHKIHNFNYNVVLKLPADNTKTNYPSF